MSARIDLEGRVFGNLTVLGPGELKTFTSGAKALYWKCRCTCGIVTEVSGHSLRAGTSKSCGCLRSKSVYVGRKYGKLTIERVIGKSSKGVLMFECVCDCGNKTLAEAGSIVHRKSCGCIKKREFGEVNFHQLFISYKKAARDRGYLWDLTKEEFRFLTQNDCYFCGTPPNQTKQIPGTSDFYMYNGVDRLDNTLGYTKDNCVPCCGQCNLAKGKLTYSDFIEMIRKIYNKHKT